VLNHVLKVFTGTCQQSVEMLSKSVTFLDFLLSQGCVATYCRWGGNLCDVYIENFLTNHLVKDFWKLVHICQSYYQTSRGLLFLEHGFIHSFINWKQEQIHTKTKLEINMHRLSKAVQYRQASWVILTKICVVNGFLSLLFS